MYVCFLDMSAAFDTVNRRKLIEKIDKMFGSQKLTRTISNLYTDTKSVVWDGNQLSQEFSTNTGVRQGCNLSAFLFNIYMNDF